MSTTRTPRQASPNGSGRFLATVLFTDIVGSTKLAAEVGDQCFRALLAAHYEILRSQLERFGGREIRTMGDGFFAIFDRPAQAISCAVTVAQKVRKQGVEIRAGIHSGECERAAGGDVQGIAVAIGARVAAVAKPGQVLVSSTVRDLVGGSGIRFRSRGTHALKGVPGRWQLHSVEGSPISVPSAPARKRISLMLVDDHPLWRETLRNVLEHDGSAIVVAEASDGTEVVDGAQAAKPDVVIMDMHLPTRNGIDATRELLAEHPETKVLVLSSWDETSTVLEAVEAGASGYLIKTAGSSEVADAVRRIHAGELVFPPALAGVMLGEFRRLAARRESKAARKAARRSGSADAPKGAPDDKGEL